MPKIEIIDLSKKYGKNLIFKKINLIIRHDLITFLIGPNGSGKTTLIKCLLNMTPFEGKIKTSSLKFSYTPESLLLPDYLTLERLLIILVSATTNDAKPVILNRINYMLKRFDLEKYRMVHIIKLSKGTKQKIILIQTLIHNADIYIFDEPLIGLDQKMRKVFIEEIKKLKLQKKIIIIATHEINSFNFRYKSIINLEDYKCLN